MFPCLAPQTWTFATVLRWKCSHLYRIILLQFYMQFRPKLQKMKTKTFLAPMASRMRRKFFFAKWHPTLRGWSQSHLFTLNFKPKNFLLKNTLAYVLEIKKSWWLIIIGQKWFRKTHYLPHLLVHPRLPTRDFFATWGVFNFRIFQGGLG